MIGKKIKYICKNCGWSAEIRAEWGDIRPKRCMNRKCNTYFPAYPDALEVIRPEKEKAESKEKPKSAAKVTPKKIKKESKSEASNKQSASS